MKFKVALALLACAASACSASGVTGGFDEEDGGNDSGASAEADGGAGPGTDSGLLGGDVIAPPPTAEVYGHSAGTLYRLDPSSKAVTVIGDFTGCKDVVDIALDATSTLYATTNDALWTVDKTTAQCTQIATGSYPNSLSFVPKGTVDPNAEALVGYEDSTYVRIDTVTGKKSAIGSIGGGLSSSGDIVSVKDGPTYLTVKGKSCSDCLIEIDPATGAMKHNYGPLGHAQVFGLAFWAGKVYGFDNSGELFMVTFNGTHIQTAEISVPNAPGGLSFWGAGSTTVAPVTPTR